ncbi:amidohydrolase family protein [Pendulispora rubella]|uniref:Amidohydrolase family protein n=1 Tax=Pendulispora rubella TaxID=2741070 RepID=A0ABZ2L6Y3_9BACT
MANIERSWAGSWFVPLAMSAGMIGCASHASAAPVAHATSAEGVKAAPNTHSVPPAPPIDPSSMPKQKPVVLRAARLFDGKGNDVLDAQGGRVSVLVENGLIAQVGKSITAPADAEVIDLGDSTLLPGFIDAHTHLAVELGDDYYRFQQERLLRSSAENALLAVPFAKKTLDAGFTTVRDVGSFYYIDVGLRNAIKAGTIEGPRMLVAVHALGATGGHADEDPFPPDIIKEPGPTDGICNGADACRRAVREQVKYGADVIKVMSSGGVLSLADAVDAPQLTPDELKAIVDEAHRLGKRVATHCHGDTAAKAAITAGVDSVEHGSFLKPDTLAMMKSNGTVLVPTFMAGDYISKRIDKMPPPIQEKARAAIAAHAQMFKNALRSGVTIGFGTDAGVYRHGDNAREFALMTNAGMSPAAALRAGTSTNAALLGISAQTGTLEKGKLADVVAVPGNPLKDITQTERVTFVMRSGHVYKRPSSETPR